MRDPGQVLEVLGAKSKENYHFDKLIRNFYNVEFYKMAYAMLYGYNKKDNANKRFDGLELNDINTLINLIKTEKYQPEPVNINVKLKRKDIRKRADGLPVFYDKLVLKVIQCILESIYDGSFEKTSHAYRPGRSCHTALMDVKKTFTGTKWWIQADINDFIGTFQNDILINLLREKIKDEKFLRLIQKFLKNGYAYEGQFEKTYAGTPSSGILTPILMNIYLDAFDRKISSIKAGFDTRKRQRKANSQYKLISERIANRRKILDTFSKEERNVLERQLETELTARTQYRKSLPEGTVADKDTGYKRHTKRIEKLRRKLRNPTDEERAKLIKEIKELRMEQRSLPAMDEFDADFKRLKYVRYADSFLIGVIGTKEETETIKDDLETFLREDLKLKLKRPNNIIHHNNKKVRFLGYDIFVAGKNVGKVSRVMNSGRYIRKRVDSDNVKLSLPYEKMKEFALGKKYIKITNDGRWVGIHRPVLMTNDPLEIVRQFNSEFSGFYQYYKLAFDVKEKLGSFHQLFVQSFARTLAGKYKTKVSKLREYEIEYNNRKYKAYVREGRWGVTYQGRNGNVHFTELYPFSRIQVVKELQDFEPDINVVDEKATRTNFARTGVIQRLNAKQCEICGDTSGPFEIHHVRKLKDIKKRSNKSYQQIKEIERSRKTIVLCGNGSKNNCHRKLHNGDLGDNSK